MSFLALRRSAARTAAAGCALLALAACSGSDGPAAPTPAQPVKPVNVAELYGELTTPALTTASALLPVGVSPSAIGAVTPASCPYVAASRSFVCAPVTANGLTVTTSYTLLDAAGNPLGADADQRTTAAMRTHSTVAGTVSLPAMSGVPAAPLTIDGTQDMTLSGLLGPTHTLNGTATTSVRGTLPLGSGVVAFSSTSTQTTKDVVLPAPTPGAAVGSLYPTSGTIVVDGTTSLGTSTPATTTHLVMTFAGSGSATVTITIAGFTQRCTIDLKTPGAAPVCTVG